MRRRMLLVALVGLAVGCGEKDKGINSEKDKPRPASSEKGR